MIAATRWIVPKSVENGAGKRNGIQRGAHERSNGTKSHQDWMHEIKDASYLSYYDRMYTHRDDTLPASIHDFMRFLRGR
jgi:hypothetical protein